MDHRANVSFDHDAFGSERRLPSLLAHRRTGRIWPDRRPESVYSPPEGRRDGHVSLDVCFGEQQLDSGHCPSGTQVASTSGTTQATLNLTNLVAGTYSVLIVPQLAATATLHVQIQ